MTSMLLYLRLFLLAIMAYIPPLRSEVLVSPPLLAIEPLGGTASFVCTLTTRLNVTFDWYIQLANQYGFQWSRHLNWFLDGGFRMETELSSSTLFVPAATFTNGSWVQCLADGVRSSSSSLYVFDTPSLPTNLSLKVVREKTLNFTWNPGFVFPGVPTRYRVIVRDATAQKVALNVSVEEGAWYEYYHSTSDPPCHAYTFSVMAFNAAGESGFSQSTATTIPTAPKFSSDPVLQVSFNPAFIHYSIASPNVCSDYPVKGYLVKMRNTIDGNNVNLGFFPPNPNSSALQIAIPLSSGLQKESIYNSTVVAFNAAGNCTASVVLYTTDVQSSTITGNNQQLNVACTFAQGSLAMGCAVYLESSGKVLQYKLPKVNMTAKGLIRTEFSVECYSISIMDWEEDGSIGPISVPMTIHIKSQSDCTVHNTDEVTHESIQIAMYGVSAVAFAAIVGLVTLVIILLVLVSYYKRKSNANILDEKSKCHPMRLRSQMSTSSDTCLLSTNLTPMTTPLSSIEPINLSPCDEQVASRPSAELICPFPSALSVKGTTASN